MPTTYAIPDGRTVMAATLYAGDGASSRSITGVGFQPDWTWIKSRTDANNHSLYDVLRGAQNLLISNTTDANQSDTTGLLSFNSDGFSVGTATRVNGTARNYVAWSWKAGGAGVTNTSGSITSTVSANPTAGFSVVTYTGTASAATIGHGLGVAPKMVITKPRNFATDWGVYHSGINDPSKALLLDSTAAAASYGGATGMWNNTAPTSTVFSVGLNNSTGGAYNYVAYCFAPVAGYSAFGSYTGNGSTDGTFIYTGFRPRFIMMKRTDAVADWVVLDTSRDTYNAAGLDLYPNTSGAEVDNRPRLDILSNGFKQRANANVSNLSGGTYIYACFAENPFKYANAR